MLVPLKNETLAGDRHHIIWRDLEAENLEVRWSPGTCHLVAKICKGPPGTTWRASSLHPGHHPTVAQMWAQERMGPTPLQTRDSGATLKSHIEESGAVAHLCHLSTQEAEAEESHLFKLCFYLPIQGVPWHTYKDQRTTCQSWFSPSAKRSWRLYSGSWA